MTAFWNIVPRSLVEVDRHFRDAYYFHHQGNEIAVYIIWTITPWVTFVTITFHKFLFYYLVLPSSKSSHFAVSYMHWILTFKMPTIPHNYITFFRYKNWVILSRWLFLKIDYGLEWRKSDLQCEEKILISHWYDHCRILVDEVAEIRKHCGWKFGQWYNMQMWWWPTNWPQALEGLNCMASYGVHCCVIKNWQDWTRWSGNNLLQLVLANA
jgi:hypothetical protein